MRMGRMPWRGAWSTARSGRTSPPITWPHTRRAGETTWKRRSACRRKTVGASSRDAPASARDSSTLELSGCERMCASRLRSVPVTSWRAACCLVCLSWPPSLRSPAPLLPSLTHRHWRHRHISCLHPSCSHTCCRIVITAYFKEKGLVRQQLDSFDEFIQNTMQELVDDAQEGESRAKARGRGRGQGGGRGEGC